MLIPHMAIDPKSMDQRNCRRIWLPRQRIGGRIFGISGLAIHNVPTVPQFHGAPRSQPD